MKALTIPEWSPVPGSLVQAYRAYWINEDVNDFSNFSAIRYTSDSELRHKVGVVIGIVDNLGDAACVLPRYVVLWTGPNVGERVTYEVQHRLREIGDVTWKSISI